MGTGDCATDNDRMGTEIEHLHGVFGGIYVAFHNDAGLAIEVAAHTAELTKIRTGDMHCLLGIAIESRSDEIGPHRDGPFGLCIIGHIGKERSVRNGLPYLLEEFPGRAALMGNLIGAVKGDNVGPGLPHLPGSLKSRGNENIGIVVPDLIQADERQVDLFLDGGNLVRRVCPQAYCTAPGCGFCHLYDEIKGITRVVRLDLAGHYQSAFELFGEFFCFAHFENDSVSFAKIKETKPKKMYGLAQEDGKSLLYSQSDMLKIRKGFQGQRLVVYPFYLGNGAERPSLQLHSMGVFPDAAYHYVERPHGCGEYVLIWCTGGEGWYELEGTRRKVSKAQFFVLPANTPHAYGAAAQQPWSIYWTHFTGPGAADAYSHINGLHTFGENSRSRETAALFDEILTILEGHSDADTAAFVDMAFPRLLSAFLYPDLWGHSGNPSIVGKAAHYMNDHIGEKLSLGDICSYLGYSESYFTRVFTKEVGCSPMAWMMQLKAERARYLLSNTRLKVNQIAPMLGFDDPYYFSKFFSKMTGLSPREYRKK